MENLRVVNISEHGGGVWVGVWFDLHILLFVCLGGWGFFLSYGG